MCAAINRNAQAPIEGVMSPPIQEERVPRSIEGVPDALARVIFRNQEVAEINQGLSSRVKQVNFWHKTRKVSDAVNAVAIIAAIVIVSVLFAGLLPFSSMLVVGCCLGLIMALLVVRGCIHSRHTHLSERLLRVLQKIKENYPGEVNVSAYAAKVLGWNFPNQAEVARQAAIDELNRVLENMRQGAPVAAVVAAPVAAAPVRKSNLELNAEFIRDALYEKASYSFIKAIKEEDAEALQRIPAPLIDLAIENKPEQNPPFMDAFKEDLAIIRSSADQGLVKQARDRVYGALMQNQDCHRAIGYYNANLYEEPVEV